MSQTNALLQYKFDLFEGPLDLMLTLISKNKLNIYDIEISKLLEQYLQQIEEMENANLDIASEFLEMAAKLIYIKSFSLLPKHEEVEDLKKELTGRLLEYRLCKQVAKILENTITYDIYLTPQSKIDYDMTYKRVHKTEDIMNAYIMACGRGKNKIKVTKDDFKGIVDRKIVSVDSRISYIFNKFNEKNTLKYNLFFKQGSEKSELVATFLAILELIKDGKIIVEGDYDNPDVILVNDWEDFYEW